MTPLTDIDGSQARAEIDRKLVAYYVHIRPLECVMFMRDVKSQSYYEQMKGRGTRIIIRANFRNKLTLHNLIGAVKGSNSLFQITS